MYLLQVVLLQIYFAELTQKQAFKLERFFFFFF